MRKFRHIPVNIYPQEVYYIHCDRAYLEKTADEFFDDDTPDIPNTSEGGVFLMEKEGRGVLVIWVSNERDIAHEVFHCANHILDVCGLELSPESEEAYAYLIGYLDSEIRKELTCEK